MLTTLLTVKNSAEKPSAVKNEQEAAKYAPSNTGRNIRDRNEHRLTADDQSLGASDTELIAKIRSSLIATENLSILAQNIKVISQKGIVTLRSPVKSIEEKKIIESKAVQVAGIKNVRNELEVEVQ